MTAAFFVTLALALLLAIVLLVRERTRRSALDHIRQAVTAANEQAELAEDLRRDAEESAGRQIVATAAMRSELEALSNERMASAEARVAELRATSRSRIETLERNLRDADSERRRLTDDAAARAAAAEATAARIAVLEKDLAELRTDSTADGASLDSGRRTRDGDAGWHLLLARVERQWADVVNAGADERGVVDGHQRDQLAQAVQRDLERLREEVGVDATMTPTEAVVDEDPFATLLAVGEAVALLAYHSEQVRVELRDQTTVSGQDWTGDDEARQQLERFAATASRAGLPVDVEVREHAVQIVIGAPGPDGTA